MRMTELELKEYLSVACDGHDMFAVCPTISSWRKPEYLIIFPGYEIINVSAEAGLSSHFASCLASFGIASSRKERSRVGYTKNENQN